MKKLAVSMFSAVVALGLFADEYITNKWTNTDAGTTITNASLWSELSNWESAFVPNGANIRVIFPEFTGSRYVKIDSPLTLNNLRGQSSDTTPIVISDSGITLSHPSSYTQLSGGRYFADFSGAEKNDFGLAGYLQINGRMTSSRLTLINQASALRLDGFASSSNPERFNDLDVDSIYRGSGHFYVVGPRKGVAHEGEWFVKAGSPYLFRDAASGPKIAAGAVVACGDIFPEGTFVKRIFSETCIELSAPASDSAGEGLRTLSFAAITPKTRICIPTMIMGTYSRTYLYFVKHEADDDFEVEVSNLVSSVTSLNNGYAKFTPRNLYSSGIFPAKMIIHDAAAGTSGNQKNAKFMQVDLGTCYLEFAETGRAGALPGFPDSLTVTEPDISASSVSRLSVTNNIHAVIGLFTNFYHVVQKEGAGTLTLGLTNNVSLNTGTLVVKEGTVVLPEGAWVKTIAVSNGATLRITGEIAPENFIAQPGARIAGEGTLSIGDAKLANGVEFVEGACLQVPGVSEWRSEAPATNVPSSVAFWVDASRIETITFADGLLTNVTRIADVRGESYGFATNTIYGGGYPVLVRDHRGRPHHIYFKYVQANSSSPDNCLALVWDKPITNICAVFQVLDTSKGGGQFLGATSRIKKQDYMRNAEWGSLYHKPIFNTGDSTAQVRNGNFYANGRPYDPDNGYPYPGGDTTRKLENNVNAKWYAPAVFSAHPAGDTQADAFGFNGKANNRNGYHRLCECLVFTNEVTETERLAITGYLMKKWMNHEVEFEVVDGNPFSSVDAQTIGGLSAVAGESHYVENFSGGGTFFKRGEGTVFVNDHACPDGSLDVVEGTLALNSHMPAMSDIPQGAYVHFDASDGSSLTVSAKGQVTAWKDVRAGDYPTAVCHASMTSGWATVTTTARGLKAVDFGPYKGRNDVYSWVNVRMSPSLYYQACGELHTVFMVMDSSQGGGVLVGCGESPGELRGPNYGYGLRRYETTGTLSYAEPILTNANWTGQKNLLYEGGSRVRLNGQKINPLTTGFSGGWDLVSLVSYEDFGGGCFASINYNQYVGGQAVGEAILYKEGLSERQIDAVEAYLRWKWFGETTPKYRPAVVSNLTVRSGATLSVVGGAPLTVNGTFSVQGTVSGDVALAGGAELVVVVGADGSVSTSGFAGALDLSNGVKVRLCGEVNKLAPGEYTIAQTAGLTFSASGSSVVSNVPFKRNLSLGLGTDGNALVLKVLAPGLRVIVR